MLLRDVFWHRFGILCVEFDFVFGRFRDKKIGNLLYDVAQAHKHKATMNWLIKANQVEFYFVVRNDSSYVIYANGIEPIYPDNYSKELSTSSILFPIVFKGYGAAWGKLIKEHTLSYDELTSGIVALGLPRKAIIKITLTLSGTVPPYTLNLSFSAFTKSESREKHTIKTTDPLDLFPKLQHHQLTESTRGVMGSALTADEILKWSDVTREQDPILNDTVITKVAGRYKRRDIYRYILNLAKDNYTIDDIQKSFDAQIQDMGKKHVANWNEYVKAHQAELAAGPFKWIGMIKRNPINKDRVVGPAIQLLQKAYRNLMIDKGGFPKGVEILD